MADRPHLVVVGGGIAGLAAAWEARRSDPDLAITVLEADSRFGGRIKTSEIDGLMVDEGADAFLARVPWGLELCRELGIDDELVSPAARNAYVYSRGALRPLPAHQVLGVPLDLDDLAATGIVSDEGIEETRRVIDTARAETMDDTIAAVLRRQVGAEVAARLVDPLVGGINAGDTERLSLRAVVPQLADAAAHDEGLVAGLRELRAAHPPDPEAPVFFGLPGGTERLIEALVVALADADVDVRTAAPVRLLRRSPSGGLELRVGGRSDPMAADHVVLAAPAPASARLVKGAAPDASSMLGSIEHASVALITFVCNRADIDHPLDGSGFLVPPVEGLDVTACSWASSKWTHLGEDEDRVVLRASVGRAGSDALLQEPDDAVAAAVGLDLSITMGLSAPPRAIRVSRWHNSFPQYLPGHLDVVDRIEADLAEQLPGVAIAGNAYRGIGIPASINSGRQAARTLLRR